MAVSSGFFNSINHDRLYDAEQMSSIFDGIINDGVFEHVGSAFKVTANLGVNDTVTVGTGRAWFDHTWTLNDADYVLTLDPPNNFMDRVDAIVIDVDHSEAVRKNSILYLTGEPAASNPSAPTMIKTDTHKQYPIVYITRHAGTSAPVSNSDIEYRVGTSDCPLVTGPLSVINSDNFFSQMQSRFDEWFEALKESMEGDVVTNILAKLDDLQTKIDNKPEGLLTPGVSDRFKKGSPGFHVNSYRSYYKGEAPDSSLLGNWRQGLSTKKDNVYHYDQQAIYESAYGFVTFLPDGTLMRAFSYHDTSTDPYISGSWHIQFTNMDGVSTVVNLDDYNSQYAANKGPYRIACPQLDSFPVSFILDSSELSGSQSAPAYLYQYIQMMKISISSDHAVQVSVTYDQSYLKQSWTPSNENKVLDTMWAAESCNSIEMNDGRYMSLLSLTGFGSSYSAATYDIAYIYILNKILMISSDGTYNITYDHEIECAQNSEEFRSTGAFIGAVSDYDYYPNYSSVSERALWVTLYPLSDGRVVFFNGVFKNTLTYDENTNTLEHNVGQFPNARGYQDYTFEQYCVINASGTGITRVTIDDDPNDEGISELLYCKSSSKKSMIQFQQNKVSTIDIPVDGYYIGIDPNYQVNDISEYYFVGASDSSSGKQYGLFPYYKQGNDYYTAFDNNCVGVYGNNGGVALFDGTTFALDSDDHGLSPWTFTSPYKNYIELSDRVGYVFYTPYIIDSSSDILEKASNSSSNSDNYKMDMANMGGTNYFIMPRVIWLIKDEEE